MGKPSHRGHLRLPPRQAWDRYQRQRESRPRNRFSNRLDVIGSHDSSADNSYAKSVVFGHVLQ